VTDPVRDTVARLVDLMPGLAFGWIAPTPAFMQRTSHAILSDGGVWLTDPVYDPVMLERVRSLGPPAGVVQQLDRHRRDCARTAEELGVPLYIVPRVAPADAPFQVLPVVHWRAGWWHEIALWFPRERVVSVAEAVGGAPYFRAPGEDLGPHPLLRVVHPPRTLIGVAAEHVLCGHGPGIHAPDAGARMAEVIRSSRRRTPRWLLGRAGMGPHQRSAGSSVRSAGPVCVAVAPWRKRLRR
jgi:hypothetical protein